MRYPVRGAAGPIPRLPASTRGRPGGPGDSGLNASPRRRVPAAGKESEHMSQLEMEELEPRQLLSRTAFFHQPLPSHPFTADFRADREAGRPFGHFGDHAGFSRHGWFGDGGAEGGPLRILVLVFS